MLHFPGDTDYFQKTTIKYHFRELSITLHFRLKDDNFWWKLYYISSKDKFISLQRICTKLCILDRESSYSQIKVNALHESSIKNVVRLSIVLIKQFLGQLSQEATQSMFTLSSTEIAQAWPMSEPELRTVTKTTRSKRVGIFLTLH